MIYIWPNTFADLGFTIKAKTFTGLFVQAGKELTQLQEIIKGSFLTQDPKLVLADIKAVTYHQLEVKQTKSGWQARVMVDV